MVIVKLSGGFGNQLFQFAAGLSLAFKNNSSLILDMRKFYRNSRKFELNSFLGLRNYCDPSFFNLNFVNPFLCKFKEKREFFYEPINLTECKKLSIDGYFQSYKYSENVKSIIENFIDKRNYRFRSKIFDRNIDIVNQYESVSIHIRRGDYLKNQHNLEYHGVIDKAYYLNAIKHIKSSLNRPKFFIFSDDISWAKENFSEIEDVNFLDNSGAYHLDDFLFMKECKHNIIANSSYSWWSAYLNSNVNKIVIAPALWIKGIEFNAKDLFPINWIILN